MTQDEIIELSKQASFTKHSEFERCLVCNIYSLYHFAKLVEERATAKERERIKEENQRCYVARGQE